ncbi:MAG: cytochrome c oxidase subunit II [Ignavibacteriaceae bacterium]|nr:cytochrome c oxidase subunit II [Ignavibacteriaceae bacterium]NUM71047.1 cytochrome c oxidase subunit II [Ignavibacteriaceae bacterium]
MFSLSNYVEKTDFAFYFITAISAVLLIFITVLMLYFVYKYNAKRHKKAVNIEGNVPLEIFWTIVPIFLVGAMFYYGYIGYDELANPPADSMHVTVTGQMWKWTFKYENGLETDTLYVPKDKAVTLDLKSLDVNHSFYIPVFKFKRDVLPNKNNSIWFRATETGSHDIACAEYCGLEHWNMYTKVVVMEQAEYDAWMQSKMPAGQ